MKLQLWAALGLIIPGTGALAEDSKDWAAFTEARRGECVGGPGTLAAPIDITAGSRKYRLEGHRLVEVGSDADKVLRVGVISAVKDDREPTLEGVAQLLARLEKRGIDVLIANGDLATNLFELQNVLPALAKSKALVVVLTGNTESCGAFNQAAEEVFARDHHLVNGNWVRRLELDDGTLLTLPGYFDRKFTHTGGAGHYDAADLEVLHDLTKGAPTPLILTSHGPPRGAGKKAIDVVNDGSNVGDPAVTELMKDRKIGFGIFGHILEGGGRATDAASKSAVAQMKWSPTLWVNAGSANRDPWGMLDGSTSYGIALYVEIEPSRARYAVEKLAAP